MLTDARQLPEDSTVDADVCIVGGGPAGLVLAKELAESHFRICLLESGDLRTDKRIQGLSVGDRVGYPYFRLEQSRVRSFGGSSNHWLPNVGLRSRPLDEIDFEPRDWIPLSGWPFDRAQLDPYYERAHRICGLGPYNYSVEAWQDSEAKKRLPIVGQEIVTTIFQFGSASRFKELGREIIESIYVTVYANANVMEIEATESEHVSRVRVGCLTGRRLWAKAKVYILATGGIENPRLLLISNATHKSGLGNQNDLVGRFFMEHLNVRSGVLYPSRPDLTQEVDLYQKHHQWGVPVMGTLSLDQSVLRKEQLTNVTFYVLPSHKELVSAGARSLAALLWAGRDRYWPRSVRRHLLRATRGSRDIAIASYKVLSGRRPDVLHLKAMAEQTPNPESRVTLTEERDPLGLRRARLDWRIADADMQSIIKSQEVVNKALEQSGLGRSDLVVEPTESLVTLQGSWHHMGTTRMHLSPRKGVVDQDCRVHGLSNLFVAGSSVFPTAGYANPTLTIVALAIRLADHLKVILNAWAPMA